MKRIGKRIVTSNKRSGVSASQISKIFGKTSKKAKQMKKISNQKIRPKGMVPWVRGDCKQSQAQAKVKAQSLSRQQPQQPQPPVPTIVEEVPKLYDVDAVEDRKRIESFNSNRTCVINATGFQRILTSEPIARYYKNLGYKVLWAVPSHLLGLSKHSDYITFIDSSYLNFDFSNKNFVNLKGTLIVPMKFSDQIVQNKDSCFIKNVYKLWNISHEEFKRSHWIRDKESENKLFEILGLSEGEQYNLISEYYHSDFSGRLSIAIDNGLRNVFVERVSSFTILDWSKVAENATNIHTVDNAFALWLQFLNLRATNKFIYPILNRYDINILAGFARK